MPKVRSYAPTWLKEPAPGHKLFARSLDEPKGPASQFRAPTKGKPGPRRTIARRGTEVFVAAGRQIRWGDLALLKDSWDIDQSSADPVTRLSRHSPNDSFGIYDDELGSRGQAWSRSAGHRVSSIPSIPTSSFNSYTEQAFGDPLPFIRSFTHSPRIRHGFAVLTRTRLTRRSRRRPPKRFASSSCPRKK